MSEMKIPADIAGMSFEAAIAELETLVTEMENGRRTLNELMTAFERGRLLSEHCRMQLSLLEKRISVLSGDDGKEGSWEAFDASAGMRN
ncbi:MAG: exodeoxyribonuclease VII small subunit [Lentisphaeria bacterium]|nr:exodeoxyribonuclease VII small subunit [Lentisphaeria bacterium]